MNKFGYTIQKGLSTISQNCRDIFVPVSIKVEIVLQAHKSFLFVKVSDIRSIIFRNVCLIKCQNTSQHKNPILAKTFHLVSNCL